MFPNVARSDKWRVAISEIPGSAGMDLRLLDNYVQSFTTPDFSVENTSSFLLGYERGNMNPSRTQGLFPFSITMKASEGFENYFAFMNWWYRLRRGNIGDTEGADGAPYMNFVPDVTIWWLDSMKRDRLRLRMQDCLLSSISALTATAGSGEELEFTLSLVANDLEFDYIGVADGQSADDMPHPSEWSGARTTVS